MTRKLTDEELIQLRAFAEREGRNWKEALGQWYWARGLPVDGLSALYGLRNSHGPSWLHSFRFPRA